MTELQRVSTGVDGRDVRQRTHVPRLLSFSAATVMCLSAVLLGGTELCVIYMPRVGEGATTFSAPAPWAGAMMSIRGSDDAPEVGVAFLLQLEGDWSQVDYLVTSSQDSAPWGDGRISGAQGRTVTINLGSAYLPGGASPQNVARLAESYRISLRAGDADRFADFAHATRDRPTWVEDALSFIQKRSCPRL